jgi:putative transposase
MDINKNIRTGRHCVFMMHAHLVFVTKYRKKVFSKAILDDIKTIFHKVCQDFEAEIVEFDGEDDHVHLLVNYPPKVAVSKLVNALKGASSYRLKRMHPALKQRYWKGALWSPSYFAGSVGGASIEVVKQYIAQQKTPH